MLRDGFSKMFVALKALLTRRVIIDCDHLHHVFHHVPLRKLLNWLLVETGVIFKPEKAWGVPTHFLIEPTNTCNLKCTLCPVTKGLKRPPGQMKLELFKQLIDEVGEYIFLILMWDWGEPFLNRQIYDMIAYAKKHDIQIISSTNGHVFANREKAIKVVQSRIDSLIFAVDGITQQTYEQYRQGGKLEEVLTGIKNVVEVKQALNSTTPLINFRFIVMRHNEHEIPKLKDFAEQLGVDVLTVRSFYPFDEMEVSAKESEGHNFLPEDETYHRFTYNSETKTRVQRKRNLCKTLWNNPAIHWDGKICPCTFDPNEKHILGDLTKETFKTIWSGTPYRKFRRQFRKNYQQLDICRNCTNAYEGGTCSTEDIVESFYFNRN